MVQGFDDPVIHVHGLEVRNAFVAHIGRQGPDGRLPGEIQGFLPQQFPGGLQTARELQGQEPADFTRETAIGALAAYVSDGTVSDFQPMNVNYGIIAPLEGKVKGKRNRNAILSQRALARLDQVLSSL